MKEMYPGPRLGVGFYLFVLFSLQATACREEPFDEQSSGEVSEQDGSAQVDALTVSDQITVLSYLEVRLAASDWQTGSWLGDIEPVELRARRASRSELSESASQGAQALDTSRLAALYQSVEASSQAVTLLQQALRWGGLEQADRERAADELVRATVGLLRIILLLDRCDAVQRRAEMAVADALTFGLAERLGAALASLDPDIAACETRVAASQPVWNPSLFLDRLNRAQNVCDEATTLPDDQAERVRGLRFECVQLRQEAISQLEVGLETGAIAGESTALAQRDLARLHEEVLTTMLRLGLVASAGMELAQTLARPDLLAPDDAEQLGMVQSRLDEGEASPDTAQEAGSEPTATAVDWDRFDALIRQNEALLQAAAAPSEVEPPQEPTPAPTPAPTDEQVSPQEPDIEPEPLEPPEPARRSSRTARSEARAQRESTPSVDGEPQPEEPSEPEPASEPAPNPFGNVGTIPTD